MKTNSQCWTMNRKIRRMRTRAGIKVATVNVGGSQEAGLYLDKLIQEHGCAVVGVTETHCKMEGKIRWRYIQIGPPRPGKSPKDSPHGWCCTCDRDRIADSTSVQESRNEFSD